MLVSEKKRRIDEGKTGLNAVAVSRSESRRGNHRLGDRHRLRGEQAKVLCLGTEQPVELINLSGGGAMVRGSFQAKLWDRVELILGDFGRVECLVRWANRDRFGLEFAHETRLDCDGSTRDDMLREVIRRSFPDLEGPLTPEPKPAEAPGEEVAQNRAEIRHPMIWGGVLHHDYEWSNARIRNISTNGAMVECEATVEAGATVYLDIGDAGRIAATVCWSVGDQIGLRFAAEFDLRLLANRMPEVTPQRWAKPDYLRDDTSESSPWASAWGRLSLSELRDTLRR